MCVVSQHPPGGRCTLYAAYAAVLNACLDARIDVVISTERDAHGAGFLAGVAEALEAPLERMMEGS